MGRMKWRTKDNTGTSSQLPHLPKRTHQRRQHRLQLKTTKQVSQVDISTDSEGYLCDGLEKLESRKRSVEIQHGSLSDSRPSNHTKHGSGHTDASTDASQNEQAITNSKVAEQSRSVGPNNPFIHSVFNTKVDTHRPHQLPDSNDRPSRLEEAQNTGGYKLSRFWSRTQLSHNEKALWENNLAAEQGCQGGDTDGYHPTSSSPEHLTSGLRVQNTRQTPLKTYSKNRTIIPTEEYCISTGEQSAKVAVDAQFAPNSSW